MGSCLWFLLFNGSEGQSAVSLEFCSASRGVFDPFHDACGFTFLKRIAASKLMFNVSSSSTFWMASKSLKRQEINMLLAMNLEKIK